MPIFVYNASTMDKKSNKQTPKTPPKMSRQVMTAILIFMAITLVYSLVSDPATEVKQYSLSEIAKNVVDGNVSKITVEGEKVKVELKDKTIGEGKKEPESALSDTLIRYGVTPAQLSSTPMEIKNESGFGYWMMNILPFALPMILIIFVVWMFLKQAKGGAMQAFTFGQSKARITDPNDKNNRPYIEHLLCRRSCFTF